jgi:hypothetical protein
VHDRPVVLGIDPGEVLAPALRDEQSESHGTSLLIAVPRCLAAVQVPLRGDLDGTAQA